MRTLSPVVLIVRQRLSGRRPTLKPACGEFPRLPRFVPQEELLQRRCSRGVFPVCVLFTLIHDEPNFRRCNTSSLSRRVLMSDYAFQANSTYSTAFQVGRVYPRAQRGVAVTRHLASLIVVKIQCRITPLGSLCTWVNSTYVITPFPVFFPLSVIAFLSPCGIVERDDYKKGEDDGSRLFIA